MTSKKLLAQGAEAKVYLQDDNIVIKERIIKPYRHPVLDEKLRRQRNKREAKLLTKAKEANINVPKVLKTDKYIIEIEFLNGERLSQTLNDYKHEKQITIMKELGKQITILHDNNLIHGDLTTSNTLLVNNNVYLIDFGLGFVSTKIEDKAVDLHLIKQALEAKHHKKHNELFFTLLENYNTKEREKTLQRLQEVEKRGRYRH